MKSKLLLVLLILFSMSFKISGQVVPKDILERVNASPYIFEGEVIRKDAYFNHDYSYIYTSITIAIKKIFKGDLDCGTVEMILLGGEIQGKILLVSHSLSLEVGDRGIFLSQKNVTREESAVDFYPENNTVVLQPTMEQQGFVKFNFDDINPEVVDYWQFHLDDIANAYDLMELYTQLNYKDCSGALNNSNHQRNKFNSDNTLSSSTDTILYQTILNPRKINSGGINYFQFDVALSDSVSSIFYMGGGCKIKYDTITFSSNMDLNGKVFVSTSDLMQDVITYPSVQVSDFQADVLNFNISWGAWQTNTVHFVDLDTQPINAFHVLMEINDCTHPSNLQFVNSPVLAKYNLVQGQSTSPMSSYSGVFGTNTAQFDTCSSLYITSISPSPITAGTEDTVTITGVGFGTTRGNGNIFLSNADDGGTSYIHLNSRDFLSNGWSNTQIQFVLPSVIDSVGPNNEGAAPGSGLVKVKTDSGDSTSTYLNIKYGIMNSIILDTLKMMVNLTPLDTLGNFGKFYFRPDTSISNYPNRMICIEAAMKQWRCMTNVNFILGADTSIVNDTSAKEDRRCRIIVGMTEDTNALATTYQHILGEIGNCNKIYTQEIDLVINRRKIQQLFFDTTSTVPIPTGMWDAYSVLLHEFGHGNSLTHVNDNTSLLWWRAYQGQAAAIRRIKLVDYPDLIDGGTYVTNHSFAIDTVNCHVTRMAQGSSNCTGLIGISEIGNKVISLDVFPNPSNGTDISIKYNVETHSNTQILVYDFSGRSIYKREMLQSNGSFIEEIPYSIFEKGCYIIHISVNSLNYVGKLIIE